MKTSYIAYPHPIFQILSKHSLPPLLFLLSCFYWLNVLSSHSWFVIFLNDIIMDLNLQSHGTLALLAPRCVLYTTRHHIAKGLTWMVWFLLVFWDNVTHLHKHTDDTGTSRLKNINIYWHTCYVHTSATCIILNK